MSNIEELKVAASRREPLARALLAEHYAYGIGIGKNIQLAYELLEQAANDGESAAAAYLSLIYAEGLWGESNIEKSRYWMALAAGGNDPHGLFNLANLIEKTAISDQQRLEALECYKRAVDAGSSFAAFRLQMAYSLGDLGNQVDPEKAAHYAALESQLREKLVTQLKD